VKTVTGQDVLDLAGKIIALCDEHTPAEAIVATEIAGKVIALQLYSSQSLEEPALSAVTRQ
jgi:hypothetical protein